MSCQGQVVVFFAYSEESYFLLLLALTSTLLPVYIFKKPISLMRKKFTQPFSPQPLNTRLIGFSLRFKKFPRKCLFSWKFLKSPSLTSTKKMIKLLVYAWFSYILALLAFNTFCLRVTLSLEIFSSLPSCLSLKSSSTFSPKFLWKSRETKIKIPTTFSCHIIKKWPTRRRKLLSSVRRQPITKRPTSIISQGKTTPFCFSMINIFLRSYKYTRLFGAQ